MVSPVKGEFGKTADSISITIGQFREICLQRVCVNIFIDPGQQKPGLFSMGATWVFFYQALQLCYGSRPVTRLIIRKFPWKTGAAGSVSSDFIWKIRDSFCSPSRSCPWGDVVMFKSGLELSEDATNWLFFTLLVNVLSPGSILLFFLIPVEYFFRWPEQWVWTHLARKQFDWQEPSRP